MYEQVDHTNERGPNLASSLVVNQRQAPMVANDYGNPVEAPSMGVGMVGVDYQVDPPRIEHGNNGMEVQAATIDKTQPNMGGQVEMGDPN